MMPPVIVFADDERGIRRFCKEELESAGYCVLLAGDGEEASHLVDSLPVDVAVLDLHMPRCDGLEAARRIKQWHPRLPVILYTVDPDYDRYKGPLVDACVVKSENVEILRDAIEQLRSPRAKDSLHRMPSPVDSSLTKSGVSERSAAV